MNRREFGKSLVALGIAAALPGYEEYIPVLHGDGVTDDTEALKHYLNGSPVRYGTQTLQLCSFHHHQMAYLPPGEYRLTETLVMR